MDDRKRSADITVRPAVPTDIPEVTQLWVRHGEGNVDLRDKAELEAAIYSGGLHIFSTENFGIIATGGFYPYAKGAYTEAGSSCWCPEFRGRGGAQVSVCFRALYASFAEPGTLIVSELYENSHKSAKVLERLGFRHIPRVPVTMHRHAHEANAKDPVRHFVLSPWQLPHCARIMLSVLNGGYAAGSDLTFSFSPSYNFDSRGIRSMIEKLALGDITMVGHSGPAPFDLPAWLALQSLEQVMDYSEFIQHLDEANYLRMS